MKIKTISMDVILGFISEGQKRDDFLDSNLFGWRTGRLLSCLIEINIKNPDFKSTNNILSKLTELPRSTVRRQCYLLARYGIITTQHHYKKKEIEIADFTYFRVNPDLLALCNLDSAAGKKEIKKFINKFLPIGIERKKSKIPLQGRFVDLVYGDLTGLKREDFGK